MTVGLLEIWRWRSWNITIYFKNLEFLDFQMLGRWFLQGTFCWYFLWTCHCTFGCQHQAGSESESILCPLCHVWTKILQIINSFDLDIFYFLRLSLFNALTSWMVSSRKCLWKESSLALWIHEHKWSMDWHLRLVCWAAFS